MEPTILLLLISLGAPTATAQPDSIDACGWFLENLPIGCVFFYGNVDDGCSVFATDFDAVPDSLDDFALVRVRAALTWHEDWCGINWYDYVIQDPVIRPCEPVDLGCGRLYYDAADGCHEWISSVYGGLQIYSLQGFADGDTVRAIGVIDYCWMSTCLISALRDVTFHPCEETPPAVKWDTWGGLKALFR